MAISIEDCNRANFACIECWESVCTEKHVLFKNLTNSTQNAYICGSTFALEAGSLVAAHVSCVAEYYAGSAEDYDDISQDLTNAGIAREMHEDH